MPLIFEVPAALSNPLIYERVGAVIKETASGKIVGHIQQMGGWDLLRHVPIPGGNPLGLATEAIQMAQLANIQQTLNTVQTLATVGAVASVASLGVSIAGFAVVLNKLNRMEGKLDQMLAQTTKVRGLVERLHVKIDALPLAALKARLESIAIARLCDESRRRDDLLVAIRELTVLRHYYSALLTSEQFCAVGTANLLALLDTQERFVAACEGELFAEFLLGGDPRVIAERWRHQKDIFDAIAWSTPKSLCQLAAQGDRDTGVDRVTNPEERVSKVAMLANIRTESTARLASLPELAGFIHEQGISAEMYLDSIEERSRATGEPLVVVDARVTS